MTTQVLLGRDVEGLADIGKVAEGVSSLSVWSRSFDVAMKL